MNCANCAAPLRTEDDRCSFCGSSVAKPVAPITAIELDPETAAAQKTVLLAEAQAIRDQQEQEVADAAAAEKAERDNAKILQLGCWVVCIIALVIGLLVWWVIRLPSSESVTAPLASDTPEQGPTEPPTFKPGPSETYFAVASSLALITTRPGLHVLLGHTNGGSDLTEWRSRAAIEHAQCILVNAMMGTPLT